MKVYKFYCKVTTPQNKQLEETNKILVLARTEEEAKQKFLMHRLEHTRKGWKFDIIKIEEEKEQNEMRNILY